MNGEKLFSHSRVIQRGKGRVSWIAERLVAPCGCENSDWIVVSGGSVIAGSNSMLFFVSYGLFGTPTGETRINLSTCEGYFKQ